MRPKMMSKSLYKIDSKYPAKPCIMLACCDTNFRLLNRVLSGPPGTSFSGFGCTKSKTPEATPPKKNKKMVTVVPGCKQQSVTAQSQHSHDTVTAQ